MNLIALAVVNDQASYLKGMKLVTEYMETPEIETSYFIGEILHICSMYYRYSKACAGDREIGRNPNYLEEAAAQAAEYWIDHWEDNEAR